MQLLWFRNDLRIHDNPALDHAIKQGVTQAIYFVCIKQWQSFNWSECKIHLVLRHVQLLQRQLATLGIHLTVVEVDNYQQQADYLLTHFANDDLITNRELELDERQRDNQLVEKGMSLIQFNADVIVDYANVLNKTGEMYRVFTPFKRAWLTYVINHGFDYLGKPPCADETYAPIEAPFEIEEKWRGCSDKWPLIDTVEKDVIPRFLDEKVERYQARRDFPFDKGTSGLSPYLAIGALSPRYLLRLLINRYPDILYSQPESVFTWLNELIWREFYRHLLFHFPDLIKGIDFNDKYASLAWPSESTYLSAWQQGKTGYPIVDAAMRQLNETGWMHNRLRMIVASFLTKHLLVDWRAGEQYFANKLIDYDFAANNGGWQWSAGTGCDAQPYFRIFNPITQSKKFDPDGDFIRKYLPEIADIPSKYIHFPHEYIKVSNHKGYWPAIVDHKVAREKALEFYKRYL